MLFIMVFGKFLDVVNEFNAFVLCVVLWEIGVSNKWFTWSETCGPAVPIFESAHENLLLIPKVLLGGAPDEVETFIE